MRPEGFEPPTTGSEDQSSIQLSYGRISDYSLSLLYFVAKAERNRSASAGFGVFQVPSDTLGFSRILGHFVGGVPSGVDLSHKFSIGGLF